MYYLGRYGSEASRQEYDRIIAEFVANGRQSLNRPDDILVEALIARFLDYTEKECNYCENTKIRIISTLRMLNKLYGKLPVANFTPTALKTLRHHYLGQGLARNTINKYIRIIRQVFSWGCEEEIVPADIAGALRMVRNLQKGRSSAVDYDAIVPVPDEIVEKTLPHIKSSQIQDMVKVQRFISGRPQDIHNMRPCDINRSGEIWKYTPITHKTKKRGKTRELPIGPRAQQILLPYLENCADPKQWVFPRPKANDYNHHYRWAIKTACKKAGAPAWTPNQLRHAGATEVREKFGLEYAQAVLGHSSAQVTEIYAKASFDKAAKVAKEIG